MATNAMIGMMLKAFGLELDPDDLIAKIELMMKYVSELRDSQLRTETMVKALYADRFKQPIPIENDNLKNGDLS